MNNSLNILSGLISRHIVECSVVLLHVPSDGFAEIAVVDECGLGSSIVGVDVFHSEVVGGEILLGHSKLGYQDRIRIPSTRNKRVLPLKS